jgi:hypothetical protein
MNRSNAYENAFAAFLRQQQIGYIAINESRRSLSLVDGETIKSPDFIVYHASGIGLLVDVKGRKFPGEISGRTRWVWECWVSAQDVLGLRRWMTHFGDKYLGVLAFVYRLAPHLDLETSPEESWVHRGRCYHLRTVLIDDYERFMRPRSPSWGTVDLPAMVFQKVSRPLREILERGASKG